MAMNLRLRKEAEEAVRAESARSGRSQQDLIRSAVDAYLGLAATPPASTTDAEALIATGAVLPPRSPFAESDEWIELPLGVTSLDLLDRDDRV